MDFRVRASVEDARAIFNDRLASICRKTVFAHYLVCRYPNCGIGLLAENLIATNWPKSLLAANSGLDLRSDKTFFGLFKTSVSPLKNVVLEGLPDRKKFSEIRFATNAACTLFSATRQQFVVVLSSPDLQIQDADLGSAIISVMHSLAKFTERPLPRHDVTQRETECLFWAAAGKSSEDIGAILQLSTHTVNGYLKSAMKKLEAINRTQAVAKATRLGVI